MWRHQGSCEGWLFASLHEQFRDDRNAVLAILTALGASSQSVKHVAGRGMGGLLQTVAGGRAGELGLFRTLEGLAVGVQGKRCLWRAAQSLAPSLCALPGGRTFIDLEARAVTQWERIDERRRNLARRTLSA
jgi:hypothetical protein